MESGQLARTPNERSAPRYLPVAGDSMSSVHSGAMPPVVAPSLHAPLSYLQEYAPTSLPAASSSSSVLGDAERAEGMGSDRTDAMSVSTALSVASSARGVPLYRRGEERAGESTIGSHQVLTSQHMMHSNTSQTSLHAPASLATKPTLSSVPPPVLVPRDTSHSQMPAPPVSAPPHMGRSSARTAPLSDSDDARHAPPKALSAAANRVAGTLSRLTRLRTRRQEDMLRDEGTRSHEDDMRSERRHAREASERLTGGAGTPRDVPPHHRSRSVPNDAPLDAQFRRCEMIGRGAFGAVYRGVHMPSGAAVALKVVDLDTPDFDVTEVRREVALLSQMRHARSKNIVRYWGCWLAGPTLCIAMDYSEGGSIRTLMKAGPIAERHAAVVVREVLVALSYIHSAGIIHRDLKAANILVTRTGHIMLCDFGVSASFVRGSSRGKRSTFIGTPYWMAPEVILEGRTYDFRADIWSLGITVYEMVTGNPPYADQDAWQVLGMIPKNKPPRLDSNYALALQEFVAACLDEEPADRPTAEELFRSKWMRAYARVPVSTLIELLQRYNKWTQGGGVRTSLLPAAPVTGPPDTTLEPEWDFDALESPADAAPAAADITADHPLRRLFDDHAVTPSADTALVSSSSSTNNFALPSPSSAAPRTPSLSSGVAASQSSSALTRPSSPNTGATGPSPALSNGVVSLASAPPVRERTGTGFSGFGSTPFRFGLGSRADTSAATQRTPELAPSASRSPSLPEATVMRTPSLPDMPASSPSTSAAGSQPASPPLGSEDHEVFPHTPPALRRVGRIPLQHRTPQRALRLVSSSSSLGMEARLHSVDEEKDSPGEARDKAHSFLEEPFEGFRPQGVMSRTRSRSGSAAELRGRASASTRRSARREALADDPSTPVHLPSSVSLSSLPVPPPQDSSHRRKHHGGSDPTVSSMRDTPSTSMHTREASDPLGSGSTGGSDERRPIAPDASHEGSISMQDVFHASPDSVPCEPFVGPPLQPLDLFTLMQRPELHVELTQTVSALGAWLDALAQGLGQVLEPARPRGT